MPRVNNEVMEATSKGSKKHSQVHTGDTLWSNIMRLVVILLSIPQEQLLADSVKPDLFIRLHNLCVIIADVFKIFVYLMLYENLV